MEEPKKKTRKASSTKENATTTKKTSTKKATTMEKEVKASKTKTVKQEVKQPKKTTTKNETKNPRTTTLKKEDEEPKAGTTKKKANEPKTDKSKKEIKTSKISSTKKTEVVQGEKKYIYISIGSIIVIIAILVLIILNAKLATHAYNVTKEKFTSQNQTEDVEAEPNDDNQEAGSTLNNQNELVSKLIEKMTFTPNATASIYKAKNFDLATISNDLKLRLGWAGIHDENKLRAKDNNGKSIIAVEKQAMEDSIQNIFGTRVRYKDASFVNTDVEEFSGASESKGIISYNNELYTASVTELGQEDSSIIYQEVQKAEQYKDRIMVYVKTAFIKAENEKYTVYKSYTEEFNNKITETTRQELFIGTSFNQYTGEGTVTIKENSNDVMNSIRDRLDTYVYTFSFDKETNEYYLSAFEKETK